MLADDPAAREAHLRQVQAKARQDFPAFYAAAQPHEAALLECLIMTKEANMALDIPLRASVPHPDRLPLERKAGQVDQIHASLCEVVRLCPAFRQLSRTEQERIEELFRI